MKAPARVGWHKTGLAPDVFISQYFVRRLLPHDSPFFVAFPDDTFEFVDVITQVIGVAVYVRL